MNFEYSNKVKDIIMKYDKHDYEINGKGYHNPVTTADKEADSFLKNTLLDARPDYGWLSEETVDSKERLKNKRVWVVDPLDGTKEFIEGVPHFVVSIGLVEDGIPIMGILYNPVTVELFEAFKGNGAKLNNKKIKCSSKIKLSEFIKLFNLDFYKKNNSVIWSHYYPKSRDNIYYLFDNLK